MSEERRQKHPDEPAEGGEEEVDSPGAEKSKRDRETDTRKGSSEHPSEPAEGGGDETDAPGADKPGSS